MSVSAETAAHGMEPSRARLLANTLPRDLGALAVLAAFVAEPSTRDFALVNLGVQSLLVVFGACVPAYRTRVMAFVDCAWSWGLAAVGVQTLLFGDAGSPVLVAVAAVYLAMGLKMGAHTVYLTATSFPREDLPRYRYRRIQWRHEGFRSETAAMLHDILMQGLGNASMLAGPAMVAVADAGGSLTPVAIAGAVVWALAFALESLADLQKARYVRRGKGGTCEVGLWRHSRHPNYFFQWLQWIGLALVAAPSLVRLADETAPLPWAGLLAAVAGIPFAMYFVLVHYTGAVPAEHFSAARRPGYRDYQRRVRRFVPGPRRG